MRRPESGHAAFWSIAGPMMLAGATSALLGIVDTAVVGHLRNPAYLGGVAVGSVVFDYLAWAAAFLRMGTLGISAQAYGSGEADRLRATLAQGLVIAAVLAALVLAAQRPILRAALQLIPGSPDVEQLARAYFDVRVWGAPANFGNLVLIGWFLGVQRARAPLAMSLLINLLNVLLDLIFVFGLGLGVRGVALATTLAQSAGFMLGLFLVGQVLGQCGGRWRRELMLERVHFVQMLRVKGDIFLRTLVLILPFTFFTAESAGMGDVTLAANTVLLRFQTLLGSGLDGFSHATQSLTGRALGARDARGFREAFSISLFWYALAGVLFAAVYALGGGALIAAMTDIETVRRAAAPYLPWLILLALVSVWAFLLDGVFIGAIRTAALRNTTMIAVFLVFFPAWYLARPLGNDGLWLAFVLLMAARGATLTAAYRSIRRRGGFLS